MFGFDHPSLNPLLGAAGMYATSANTRLEPRARENLKQALRWCATNNRARDYDSLLGMAQKMPADIRARMLDALNAEADRFVYRQASGRNYRACIRSFPLVIETDRATSDLDAGAIADIQKTLRLLGVTSEGVSIEVLPWLTSTPVHADNPISRLKLLQRVLDVVITRRATERYVSTSALYSDPMANLSLLPARPQDAEPHIQPGSACLRFLTLVVVSTEGASPQRELDNDIWLRELAQIVWRRGQYRFVQGASACFSAADALADGTLDLACLQIADFIRALEPIAEDWPGQCSVVIRLKPADEPPGSRVAITCIHEGQPLASTQIELPAIASDQARRVEELASSVAYRAAHALDIASIVVAGPDPRAGSMS